MGINEVIERVVENVNIVEEMKEFVKLKERIGTGEDLEEVGIVLQKYRKEDVVRGFSEQYLMLNKDERDEDLERYLDLVV